MANRASEEGGEQNEHSTDCADRFRRRLLILRRARDGAPMVVVRRQRARLGISEPRSIATITSSPISSPRHAQDHPIGVVNFSAF
jgi:hypothetical protein